MNPGYFDQLKKIESGGNPLAKNPKTSAKGYYQFVNATAAQYGLDKYDFGTPEYTQAEEEAARKLTADNAESLKSKLGRNPTEGELYLAHQQGAEGAYKILSANPDEKAINVLGVDQVLNNGGTDQMTVEEFKQKWTSKFDTQQDQTQQADAANETAFVDIDPLADFGIKAGVDIDPLADFNIKVEDKFLTNDDGFGSIKKSMIDQKRGAPSYVRQVVGGLSDPESRLATLRKFYPDAQPFEENNFVYTDPETGKPTLYNKEGFDRGDIASITKDIFTTAGSSIGAAAGAIAGAAVSIPTIGSAAPVSVPSGAIIGSGLGAGAASNLYDAWMTFSGQAVDVRSPGEMAAETSLDVAFGSLGEGIGRAIPVMAKEAIGGAKATSRAIVNQFARLGIRPTIGVTQGGSGQFLEAGLTQNISSAGIMLEQVDDVIKQSNDALNNIIAKYGTPKSKEGAGRVIQAAAGKAVSRSEDKISSLYTQAFDKIGEDRQVMPSSVMALAKEMSDEISKAPRARSMVYDKANKMLAAIIADSTDTGGIPFSTLRAIRTDIGRDLDNPLSSGATSSQNVAMKRIYAALTDDLSLAADEAGPEAKAAIKRADSYKRAFENNAREMLNKILKYDAEDNAYKFAIAGSKDGGVSLRKLRKLFTQEEWDDVSATVLNQLGNDAVAGDFSINKFVTNYKNLSVEAKDALFRGGKYKENAAALEDFVDLMSKLKDAKRFENTSNTAGAVQTNMILMQLGGSVAFAGGGALAGEQTGYGPIAGAIGGVLAPRYAAKLITNPAFVEWLSMPVKKGVQDTSAYFTKLYLIGESNQEIKQEIDMLIDALEKSTRPQ